MKVLICDPVGKNAVDLLKKKGFLIDYEPAIGPEELLTKIDNYEALIIRSRTKITEEVIKKAGGLKIIGRVGTGVDNIDISIAKRHGIVVINAPGANAQAVAELTIGLILTLLRKINLADSSLRRGEWRKKDLVGEELEGKTLGIIGYGWIGKRIGELATAFGANIKHHDKDDYEENLIELFKTSDIVSLHLILTPQTKNFINAGRLALMKPSSYLINCARAQVIDEDALFEALKNKKIAGAALDVFWQEPLPADSPWTKLENIVMTPHLGAGTIEASEKASLMIASDLIKFSQGQKVLNQVNL